MNTRINKFKFADFTEAWDGLHDWFLNHEDTIRKRGGLTYGSELVSYDNMIYIERARLDSKFNFGRTLGYSRKKWSKLINNYINFNYLDLIASEIRAREGKKSSNYNYTFHFDNSHGSGKDCLISLTFIRRKGADNPVVIYNTRASEVTKRLVFDFLLIQRMVEYVYGRKVKVECICFIPFAFINLECSMMYVSDRGVDCLKKKKGEYSPYQERLMTKYNKWLTIDTNLVRYKVHQRAARQVQRDANNNPIAGVPDLFAKELKLIPSNKIKYNEVRRLNEEINHA